MEQNQSRDAVRKAAKIILIIVIAFILGAAIFTFFKIRVDARAALRDAKNVRVALRSADIEMYAKNQSIYNPLKKNGLESGVKEKVEQIVITDGNFSVTSYDSTHHELTGMTYRTGNYVVYFKKNGDEIKWEVNYIMNVLYYDESDVVVD